MRMDIFLLILDERQVVDDACNFETNNCCYSNDSENPNGAEHTSVVSNVAVLCASSLAPSYDPTDYGDAVENSAEEIAPAGERLVSLRQMLFDFSQLLLLGDLLNLNFFHILSPFPLTSSECLQ